MRYGGGLISGVLACTTSREQGREYPGENCARAHYFCRDCTIFEKPAELLLCHCHHRLYIMAGAAFWPEQIRDLDRNLHGDFLVFAVQNVACAVTVLTVLSPLPIVRKVTKRRGTGEYSYLPYLLNFFSSVLALSYGAYPP